MTKYLQKIFVYTNKWWKQSLQKKKKVQITTKENYTDNVKKCFKQKKNIYEVLCQINNYYYIEKQMKKTKCQNK